MSTLPLISVVIPAYNHRLYIQECLESISNQDYPNLEVIYVDDGSTDGTKQIAENFLSSSSLTYQFISQENRGAHQAINCGIEIAKGEYIAILNSDDRFYPARLSTMYTALSESKRRFAFSKVLHIDKQGKCHPYQDEYLSNLEYAKRFPSLSFEFLRSNIAATTGNFFFHKSIFYDVGPFNSYLTCHDWDYILRVLLIEEPFFVDAIMLDYRIHPEGALQKNLDKVDDEVEQIMLAYFERLPEATNQLAPGPKWGVYWNYFSTNFLERIRKSPRVNEMIKPTLFNQQKTDFADAEEVRKVKQEFLDFVGPPKPLNLDLIEVSLETPKINSSEPKDRLRMLIILPWLVMGGAERFILSMMDQLSQTGWSFTIVTTAPAENVWKGKFLERTADIYELPDFLPLNEYPRFLKYLIELRQIDLIFLQGTIEGYRLLPFLRTAFPNIPIVDYLHFVIPEWMDGAYPRLSFLYRDCLDMTITSCEQVRNWMVEQGDNECRIKVCTINPDPEYWHPDEERRRSTRELFRIEGDKVVILYAARLENQKQPDVMLGTLKRLSERGLDFYAFVAGEGSLYSFLRNGVIEASLDQKVFFVGSVDPDKMRDLYAASDIFFLPSQNEGISLAIYEAMACGLPIVAANVGGQAELVTPKCGFLLSPEPKEEMESSYTEVLLKLIQNPSLRKQMGEAGRQRIVTSFSIEKMKNCVNGALQEALQMRSRKIEEHEVGLSPNELAVRAARYAIEYFYAKSELRRMGEMYNDLSVQYNELSVQYNELTRYYQELSKKYFELLQPKPARYWFYLWIRQLLLPIYKLLIDGGGDFQPIGWIKDKMKRIIIGKE